MLMHILLNQSEEREKIGNIVPGLWIGSFLDFNSSSFSLWLTTRMQLNTLIMFFLLKGLTFKIPILLWNTLLNGFPLKQIKIYFKRLKIWAYLCIINSLWYSVASCIYVIIIIIWQFLARTGKLHLLTFSNVQVLLNMNCQNFYDLKQSNRHCPRAIYDCILAIFQSTQSRPWGILLEFRRLSDMILCIMILCSGGSEEGWLFPVPLSNSQNKLWDLRFQLKILLMALKIYLTLVSAGMVELIIS